MLNTDINLKISLAELLALKTIPGNYYFNIQEIDLYYVPVAFYQKSHSSLEKYGVIVEDGNIFGAATIASLADELKRIFGNNVVIQLSDTIKLHPQVH